VNTDGLISFNVRVDGSIMYTPRLMPISSATPPFIAPYWADADTAKNGRIYYRPVTGTVD